MLSEESPAEYHSDAFAILGYNRGLYYYLPKGTGQVIELRADQHVSGRLIEMASRQWWEQHYPGKGGPEWLMAQNSLIRLSQMVGIYKPNRVRGRGAWWDDEGHAVIHLGDKLIVKGKERELAESTRYIYEKAEPIRINYKNPLTAIEAKKFSDICDMLSWEHKISSRYLSGWCAIAPICGALKWRPHIWVTGGAGSGKSTIVEQIITPIVGDIGMPALSSTTEAGLRQDMNSDARPIIFDEIDGSGPRAQDRIQNVLELSRAAASDTKAKIIKGSVTGKAMKFEIRSCFAFSSIGVFATSRPDETRITVLGLKLGMDRSKFEKLIDAISNLMTEEYIQRFNARSVMMIPVMRSNSYIFAKAGAAVLGTQRAGDQMGALLGGAWTLHSDKAVTMGQATAWIEKEDWSESKVNAGDNDEAKCLAYLMQSVVRSNSSGGPRDFSIAELAEIASGRKASTDNEVAGAISTLGTYGFRADPDHLVVSSSHSAVAKILERTEWGKNWRLTLGRLPGAKPTHGTVRFGATKTRGTEIQYDKPDDHGDL